MYILYLYICLGTALMMGIVEAMLDHLGKNHGGTLQKNKTKKPRDV